MSDDNELAIRPEGDPEQGKIGWALAWLVRIPLPVLLIIYLFTRAC